MSDELKPKQKLKALGLKLPESQENPLKTEFDKLESAVEDLSNGFPEFQNDVGNQTSFSEFETYLTDTLGLSADVSASLRSKFEAKYGDFSTFQTELDSFITFDEWLNSFKWGDTIGGETTSDGVESNQGIRFHSEEGVTKEDVQVPAGTVEIFGPEIHFSQTGATADEEEDKSSLFSYSNETLSDSSIFLDESATFSVDLTNNGSYQERFLPVLVVDGEKEKEGDLIKIGPGNTRTIAFEFFPPDTGDFDLRINKSATRTITVNNSGL